MANQQRLNVLIVDREEEAQLQLKELLSEQGYGVTCL
jgi:CheY-like chemotaxis protein